MMIYREVYYMALSGLGALAFSATLVKCLKNKREGDDPEPVECALLMLALYCMLCFAINLAALGDVFPTISSAQKPAMARGGRV